MPSPRVFVVRKQKNKIQTEVKIVSTWYFKVLIIALVSLFFSQGCYFHARIGSVKQPPGSMEKMAASSMPEKPVAMK